MKQFLFPNYTQNITIAAALVAGSLLTALLPITSLLNLKSNASLSLDTSHDLPITTSVDDDTDEDEAAELYDFPYPIIIKAVHPGYTIDGISDVGELIELQNLSDVPLSLAGFSLRYTNGTGSKTVTIFEFPAESLMTGETLLLRYQSKNLPTPEPADIYYETSLAMSAGPLELIAEGVVVDTVCWNNSPDCYKEFKSKSPTSLVRNLITGEFEHLASYTPPFDPEHPAYYAPPVVDATDEPEEDFVAPPQCFALEFSELYSYYNTDQSEQFIELYNPSSVTVSLDGCQFRYKKKLYPLEGSIAPDTYYAYYPGDQFSLTKNPSSTVSIELIDADGSVVEELIYSKGQKKSVSYARFYDDTGQEVWRQTYAITPNAENLYQEYRTCEAGKVINPLTGNCVKSTSLESSITICPEGKYLNPLTGRCKSLASDTTTFKPCDEGYERNPETNRCRKITSVNDGADYTIVPTTRSDSKTFIAFGIVALLVLGGVIYIVLQFRREIARMIRKIRQRLNHIFQNLLAGKIGLHRNKKP